MHLWCYLKEPAITSSARWPVSALLVTISADALAYGEEILVVPGALLVAFLIFFLIWRRPWLYKLPAIAVYFALVMGLPKLYFKTGNWWADEILAIAVFIFLPAVLWIVAVRVVNRFSESEEHA